MDNVKANSVDKNTKEEKRYIIEEKHKQHVRWGTTQAHSRNYRFYARTPFLIIIFEATERWSKM